MVVFGVANAQTTVSAAIEAGQRLRSAMEAVAFMGACIGESSDVGKSTSGTEPRALGLRLFAVGGEG